MRTARASGALLSGVLFRCATRRTAAVRSSAARCHGALLASALLRRPNIAIATGLVIHLTKDEKILQVQIRGCAQGKKPPQKNVNGKNWITRFLNRHPILAAIFAGRVERQPVNASSPRIINDHFKQLGKIMRSN